MIIYNVTINIHEDIHDQWLLWFYLLICRISNRFMMIP